LFRSGLPLTKPCNHSGMVLTGTKAFERNVSGNRIRNEIPCTLEALRAITPKKAKIQLSAQAQTITSRPASTTPPRPPPHDEAHHEGERGGDEVADRVGEQSAGERRDA